MEIKGITTLEWWLTKWLNEHDFPIVKARVATDFQYEDRTKTIYFALVSDSSLEANFLKFVQDTLSFPYDCDGFILSFFHELGHYMTFENWTETDWINYYLEKMCINLSSPCRNEEYWSLPIEHCATKWGCNYIVDNSNEIENFWRITKKLLMNIYKLNNMEVEG